jgi:hypothetical protein
VEGLSFLFPKVEDIRLDQEVGELIEGFVDQWGVALLVCEEILLRIGKEGEWLINWFCFEARGVDGTSSAHHGFEHRGVLSDIADKWGLDHFVGPSFYRNLYWVVEVVVVLPRRSWVFAGSGSIWAFDRLL